MRYYYLTTQKAESKPQRTYPNGDAIPDSLPESYQPDQHCGNCGAYNPTTKTVFITGKDWDKMFEIKLK